MSTPDRYARVLGSLETEAHAWVRLLTSGAATADDADAMRQWCARSDQHAAAFARAQRVWQAIGVAGASVSNRDPLPARRPAREAATRPMRRRLLVGGLAAAGAGAVAVVAQPMLGLSLGALGADYSTGTGEQRHVVLDSQVELDLNTRTRVAVRGEGAARGRSIELLDGEAAVDTARSTGAFAVLAGAGRTEARAGQARFEVRHLADRTCVTCLSGEVSVRHSAGTLVLREREQVEYDRVALGATSAVDIEAASAWRDGVLLFRQTALVDVIDEINRYRPGKVVLLKQSVAQLPLSGRFRIDDLDQVLRQISLAFRVDARSLPGNIVLLS
ncbi:FecR family protein [Orrella dioscoreae]|nr:FecR domain-containing protein [Orrella dioscoreae]